MVTLLSEGRKSSCSSWRVTIGFWLIRRPNFLDYLGEIFLGAHVLFFIVNCVTPFKLCNEWIYRSERNIQVAWDISIIFTIFTKLNNQCILWITKFFTSVTLCGWSAKQTIPLSVLARNQTKAWARNLDATGSRQRNTSQGVERRNPEEAVGDGRRRRAVGSRHRTSERPVAWDRVQHQWGKTSQDELAFLVALWKFREGCTSALVYRCTKESRVSQLNVLALELTKPILFVCSFVLFSHSIDCSHEEMCDIVTPLAMNRNFLYDSQLQKFRADFKIELLLLVTL